MGLPKKASTAIVDSVLETVRKTLEEGKPVKISGFGNFVTRKKKTRQGRNPQTGQAAAISGRTVVTFKPSQILRARVNKG
ncbi:MAG: integration host factor subunit alpha [Magnetococcus sp. DMHC-1]